MPITIKSTGMKYKNPDTGVYQGVDMLEEATIRDVIVDVYSPTLPYAVGEYCLYNGELYCCTTAIPSGGETWNLAHWDKTNVTDELEDIKSAVDSIGSDDVANESNVSGTTVSDALDTLDVSVNVLTEAASTESITLAENKYIKNNVGVGETVSLTPIDYTGYRCAVVECSEGDEFILKKVRGGSTPRLYSFLDSSNAVLEVAIASKYIRDPYLITAPTGSAKVVFNDHEENFPGSIYAFPDLKDIIMHDTMHDTHTSILSDPSSIDAIKSYDAGIYRVAISGTSVFPSSYGILEILKGEYYCTARFSTINASNPRTWRVEWNTSGGWYNNVWTDEQKAVKEGKLSKTGDTYTAPLVYHTDSYTSGTAPSSNQYKSFFELSDAANNHIVIFQGTSYTTGEEGFEIVTRRNQNGTWKYNSLRLLMDASFNQKVYVTNREAWRQALGYAAGESFSIQYRGLGRTTASPADRMFFGLQLDFPITVDKDHITAKVTGTQNILPIGHSTTTGGLSTTAVAAYGVTRNVATFSIPTVNTGLAANLVYYMELNLTITLS